MDSYCQDELERACYTQVRAEGLGVTAWWHHLKAYDAVS